IRVPSLVPGAILFLRRVLLHGEGARSWGLGPGYGFDHADRDMHHIVTDHAEWNRVPRIAPGDPVEGSLQCPESGWRFDFAPRVCVLRAVWHCRRHHLPVLRSEAALEMACHGRRSPARTWLLRLRRKRESRRPGVQGLHKVLLISGTGR